MRTNFIKSSIMTLTWLLPFIIVLTLTPADAAVTAAASTSTSTNQIFNVTCRIQSDCTTAHTYASYATYMKCVEGRCLCELHTQFDDFNGICRIRVPSQCKIQHSQDEKVQPCVRNAVCAYPLDKHGNELKTALHGVCQCSINRSPSQDGICSGSVSSNTFRHTGYSFVLLMTCVLIVLGQKQ